MSRFDSVVSAEAWNGLVRDLIDARDESGEGHSTDFIIAEIVRNVVYEVEGEEL